MIFATPKCRDVTSSHIFHSGMSYFEILRKDFLSTVDITQYTSLFLEMWTHSSSSWSLRSWLSKLPNLNRQRWFLFSCTSRSCAQRVDFTTRRCNRCGGPGHLARYEWNSKLISIHLSYLIRDCLAGTSTLITYDSIPTGPSAANTNKVKTCSKCWQEGHVSFPVCSFKFKYIIQSFRLPGNTQKLPSLSNKK